MMFNIRKIVPEALQFQSDLTFPSFRFKFLISSTLS